MIVNEGSKTTIANISKVIAGESYSFPNRQYNSPVFTYENGCCQKRVFNRIGKRNLEVSPVQWDHNYCRIFCKIENSSYQRIPEMDLFAS